MYTFISTGKKVIEKKSENVLEIFNYIADNFKFEVQEFDVTEEFLNNENNKKLDYLISKI